MKQITVLDSVSEQRFVEEFVRRNEPVVVHDLGFDPANWNPAYFRDHLGDLPVLLYDTLFDLKEVSSLASYIDGHFGKDGPLARGVPYVRWYNRIKDVEHAWGDEAFQRLSPLWTRPSFLPKTDLLVPPRKENDPVTDRFPYRGILIAAKGARTRLHRDPFYSDAVVAQFYGRKEVAMYHPSRAEEMRNVGKDGTSFGGFIDVRNDDLHKVSVEPDYHGFIGPGDVAYIPHGWLHDVIALDDSISITWNFVHEMGSMEFIDYLMNDPETDSEFEVLNYFYQLAGYRFQSSREIVRAFDQKFADIQDLLDCE